MAPTPVLRQHPVAGICGVACVALAAEKGHVHELVPGRIVAAFGGSPEKADALFREAMEIVASEEEALGDEPTTAAVAVSLARVLARRALDEGAPADATGGVLVAGVMPRVAIFFVSPDGNVSEARSAAFGSGHDEAPLPDVAGASAGEIVQQLRWWVKSAGAKEASTVVLEAVRDDGERWAIPEAL